MWSEYEMWSEFTKCGIYTRVQTYRIGMLTPPAVKVVTASTAAPPKKKKPAAVPHTPACKRKLTFEESSTSDQ